MSRKSKYLEKAAIIKAQNPDWPTRKVLKEAGWKSTAYPKWVKSEKFNSLVKENEREIGAKSTTDEVIELADEILLKRLKNNPDDISTKSVIDIVLQGLRLKSKEPPPDESPPNPEEEIEKIKKQLPEGVGEKLLESPGTEEEIS